MTFFGKLLVFLNAILATALLSWSLSLFTNRVDWPTVPADGKKLTEWPSLYNQDAAANNGAYADARVAVALSERQLADRTKLLGDKLQQARGGKFYELDRAAPKPGQFPSDRFNLDSQIATKVARKDGSLADLQGLKPITDELQATTTKILGDDDQGPMKVNPDDLKRDELAGLTGKKGLAAIRGRLTGLDTQVAAVNGGIDRLRVALVQQEDEKRYLADNQVNWDAQLITLQKRNDQLVERLKGFGAIRTVAPTPAPALAGSR